MCTLAPGTGTQDGAERLKKRGDIRDVKRGGYLPVHFFFQITGIVRIVRALEVTAARWCPRIRPSISTTISTTKKTTISTWCPIQGLLLKSLQRLATTCEGFTAVRRSRFGHSEVATTHRDGDKPVKLTTTTTTTTTTTNRPCGRCRRGYRSR
jgi:hypothetical protein